MTFHMILPQREHRPACTLPKEIVLIRIVAIPMFGCRQLPWYADPLRSMATARKAQAVKTAISMNAQISATQVHVPRGAANCRTDIKRALCEPTQTAWMYQQRKKIVISPVMRMKKSMMTISIQMTLMRSISATLASLMRNQCSRITFNCHLDFCVTTNDTYKLLWGCWYFERAYRSYRVLPILAFRFVSALIHIPLSHGHCALITLPGYAWRSDY